jgi:NAD(P) transhydrogenase
MSRLRLAAAGLSDEHGLIHVDEDYRTDVHHIYAAGDVVGFPALPSTSMQQARTAMLHAFRRKASHASRLLPSGVHTIPEVGTIGETEDSLRKKGIEYVVGRSEYRANARSLIVGDAGGFIKLLFQRDNMKLIGVHLMGDHAAELVHVGMMAMVGGVVAETLAGLCFNLPTLGELYKMAALDAVRAAFEIRGAVA